MAGIAGEKQALATQVWRLKTYRTFELCLLLHQCYNAAGFAQSHTQPLTAGNRSGALGIIVTL